MTKQSKRSRLLVLHCKGMVWYFGINAHLLDTKINTTLISVIYKATASSHLAYLSLVSLKAGNTGKV